jgi:hypothetical protein
MVSRVIITSLERSGAGLNFSIFFVLTSADDLPPEGFTVPVVETSCDAT